jgi:hypothetical protein
MFELFNDMYFIVYKLYYVDQNDNLGIRIRLRLLIVESNID